MAAMAASLMCCGVAKCGSPAPKSTSFAPCARSLAASAVTALVAEVSIRPIRSEKSALAVVVIRIFFQILGFSGQESRGGAGENPGSAKTEQDRCRRKALYREVNFSAHVAGLPSMRCVMQELGRRRWQCGRGGAEQAVRGWHRFWRRHSGLRDGNRGNWRRCCESPRTRNRRNRSAERAEAAEQVWLRISDMRLCSRRNRPDK